MEPDFLQSIVRAVIKTLGPGSVGTSSADFGSDVRDWIPTGSSAIERAIGWPGIPMARLTTIRGYDKTGKTTLLTHIIAEAQKKGVLCYLIETERAWDSERARVLGVDTNKLVVSQPDHLEQVFTILRIVVEWVEQAKGKAPPVLFAWDSVAATPTREECGVDDKDEGTSKGAHARGLSRMFRKMMGRCQNSNITLLFVNQNKDDINIGRFGGGNFAVMIAERPIAYNASLELTVKRGSKIKKGSETVGVQCAVRVSRSKIGAPFREAQVPILFEKGIDESQRGTATKGR